MILKQDMDRIKNNRGPEDLKRKIEDLTKQKEYLQRQCRKAGEAILAQEGKYTALEKEYDKVVEENNTIKTMMKK